MSTVRPAGPVRSRGTQVPGKGDMEFIPHTTEHLWKRMNGRYRADLWNHLEKIKTMKTENKASEKNRAIINSRKNKMLYKK